MSVTRFGVSLLNVVATIDRPASHHGTERPEAKNSDVLLPGALAEEQRRHEADQRRRWRQRSPVERLQVHGGGMYLKRRGMTRSVRGLEAGDWSQSRVPPASPSVVRCSSDRLERAEVLVIGSSPWPPVASRAGPSTAPAPSRRTRRAPRSAHGRSRVWQRDSSRRGASPGRRLPCRSPATWAGPGRSGRRIGAKFDQYVIIASDSAAVGLAPRSPSAPSRAPRRRIRFRRRAGRRCRWHVASDAVHLGVGGDRDLPVERVAIHGARRRSAAASRSTSMSRRPMNSVARQCGRRLDGLGVGSWPDTP